MIQITEDLKRDILRAYEKLGGREFNRLFRSDMTYNVTINQYLRDTKVMTKAMADRIKNIVDLDRYIEASHFKVSSIEDIERFSEIEIDNTYYDEDEVKDIYIELAKCFISKLDEMLFYLLRKNSTDPLIWGLLFAIGSKHLEGRSMSSVAKEIGVTKAAISKHARRFVKGLCLPTSPYMMTEDNAQLYRHVALEYHKNKKGESNDFNG